MVIASATETQPAVQHSGRALAYADAIGQVAVSVSGSGGRLGEGAGRSGGS